jgi:hypothetical protein
MIEVLINVFFAIGLLFCRNPATTWLSGFSMGTAVSLFVHLYLS